MTAPAPADPTPGGALTGCLGGGLLLALAHALAFFGFAYLEGRDRQAAFPPPEHGGFLSLLLLLNPGATAVALFPVALVLLHRRRQALLGFCVAAGLIVLLNGACWGFVSLRDAR